MMQDLLGDALDVLPERRVLVGFDGGVPLIFKDFVALCVRPPPNQPRTIEKAQSSVGSGFAWRRSSQWRRKRVRPGVC